MVNETKIVITVYKLSQYTRQFCTSFYAHKELRLTRVVKPHSYKLYHPLLNTLEIYSLYYVKLAICAHGMGTKYIAALQIYMYQRDLDWHKLHFV